jgi:hypothetical protein
MSNKLFDISLNQGKQFNNYQTKIKKSVNKNMIKSRSIKEGFVTSEQEKMVRPKDDGYTSVLENQERGSRLVNSVNQRDLDELQQLQAKYNDLIQQYTSIQKSIGDSSLATIDRLSSNNPYLNNTIRFTTGHICYVTTEGVVKYIPSPDIWNSTIAPKNYIDINLPWIDSYSTPGTTIPTNPPLISGTFVKMNESLGNEGRNVYTSKLINNPTSDYVGCYNDKPPSTNINAIPVMNASNNVNGFASYASSVYMSNNDAVGPWAAFDQNPNTVWHSAADSADFPQHAYNAATGVYEGSTGVGTGNVGSIYGEYLQISMPGITTASAQNITVSQYSIAPRLDLITTRSPNSWYVLGYDGTQWNQIDRQVSQQFTSGTPKSYNIPNPAGYSGYILLIDKVGNDDQTYNRYCVQVAEWNLFMNSDSTMSDDKRAMIWNPSIIGYTTLDKCQEYAVDNGYQYFGMQDYRSDGTAACLVSNDLLRTQMYGDASLQVSGYPIWASNTSGNIKAYITADGRFVVNDQVTGGIIWSSPNAPADCWWGGLVNPDSIQGSYGGNCVGKPLGIDCGNPDPNQSYGTEGIVGNLNSQLKNAALQNSYSSTSSFSYAPLSEFTGGDPAFCCAKMVDYSYQCGGNAFKTGSVSGGTNINFDCSAEAARCKFFVILQDDGNLCLYRGTSPADNQGAIWCAMTNGKQKSPNPDWVASKGKTGVNYLVSGQALYPDEWIGSTDGSLKLIMQTDGNLVLYTSESKAGCVKGQNDKTYGGGWVNAVYKLNAAGDPSSLGKVAYIDSDSTLKEYPDSMLGLTNEYQIYQNTDSGGNDITSMIVTDEMQCQTSCNNTPDCAVYAYMPSTKTCWLKNKNSYPKSSKYPLSDRNLGVRKPGLTGSTTCSNEIVDIDTVQYDNYNKGAGMTPDTQCNASLVSQSDRIQFDNIKNQLSTLGQDIASKMESLYNQDNKVYEKLNMNAQQFKKDLEKYKTINLKIRQELEIQSNNNIEGMTNFKLNMNDINGMLSDTDLRVLQGNYSYIMWSILAVGILTITINTMKK